VNTENEATAGNGLALKDLVMWVLGALMSVLLLLGNATLGNIDKKLEAFDKKFDDLQGVVIRHERELGGVDDMKQRLDAMENRERDRLSDANH
jgi:hypothetical protein